MRHRKTACFEALVLEPHFAQSCARFLLLYGLLGWRTSLQCLKVAAHVLVKPWFAAPPPCTFHCFVRKVKKMPIEDIHLALAPNPRVLLGFCAPSSAVSVAGGWWVAAVGFVVVLQRYRSCGSWACPGGLVSGWTWCWGRIWGYLAGWI